MGHVLFIDGNSLAHANHNASKLTVGPMQTQAIFGFLKSLRFMLRTMPGKPIVAWDGQAQFRLAIHPEYKGNRKPKTAEQQADKDAFRAQMPFLEKMLELCGVVQMRSPFLEADDLAGYLVPQLARTRPVTMVSGDQDWLQLVGTNSTWFDPIRDRKVNLDNFYDSTGFKDTRAFVQGKCLIGDISDNVTGIDDIGKGTAPLFMAEHGTVDAFYRKIDAGTYRPKYRKSKTAKTPHYEQALASPEGRALFARNMQLMDLSQARRPAPGELIFIKKAPDRAKFEALCKRLMFASIVREMDDFCELFGMNEALAA